MSTGCRILAISFLVLGVVGCGSDASGTGSPSEREHLGPRSNAPTLADGPIGGGLASGTGSEIELVCPPGVKEDVIEWQYPSATSQEEAVAGAFGDLIVGRIGEPFELESTDAWTSWGLEDHAGNLIAVATIVVSGSGWDPSHARYCYIEPPSDPAPPFTLIVSNQSRDHRAVAITVTIDGEVVVDEDFDVKDQHHWAHFESDIGPGTHTLHAVSSTGAELTIEFATEDGVPLWILLDYWFYDKEGHPNFESRITTEAPVFG